MATKKPRSITFKFDSSPASQAKANALLSALAGKPFPGPSCSENGLLGRTNAEIEAIGAGSGD